ncbi:phosphatidylethanolamine-binding protein 2 isoform X2 [Bemisia tabaci]|uniref:phosphatidylethanolamine-binding protein 2 isoform X2 n=1 Tax=Bemisia tabaci TaxID=7038 RepID=UPI0008F9DCC0|nr:PREDICTED: phosphatidylethanolamine-binding protein 2-like isoform X2 [Bemisia tabaci]
MFSSYIQGVINLLSNRISSKRKGPRYIFYLFVFSCSVEIGVISAEKIPKFNPDYMRKALTEYKIYPYLLPDLPKYPIEVYFGEHEVTFGNRLYWNDTKDEPTSVHWPAKKDREYILAAIGPDVPSRENPDPEFLSSWEHWMIGNIPANNLSAGDVLSEYVGITGPEYEIGTHRLVFLVFKQNPVRQWTLEGMTVNQTIMFEEGLLKKKVIGLMRSSFYPRRIPKKYNMVLDPIAVNFCVVHQKKPVYVEPTEPPDETETPEDSEEQEELRRAKAENRTVVFSTTTEEVGSLILDRSRTWS